MHIVLEQEAGDCCCGSGHVNWPIIAQHFGQVWQRAAMVEVKMSYDNAINCISHSLAFCSAEL